MPKIRERKLSVSFYTTCSCGLDKGFYSNPTESEMKSLDKIFCEAAQKTEEKPCMVCQLELRLKKRFPDLSKEELRAKALELKETIDKENKNA